MKEIVIQQTVFRESVRGVNRQTGLNEWVPELDK